MKLVIQRVKRAHVEVSGQMISEISQGLFVLIGVLKGDTIKDSEYLARKIVNLRIFEDDQGKMNRSVRDVEGDILVVSQFTLGADCRKGNRPGFNKAEVPARAEELYEHFCQHVGLMYKKPFQGCFGARMDICVVNEGPVTILLDSKAG